MKSHDILKIASDRILSLKGETLNLISLSKPKNLEYARQYARVVSKLSPMLGNMIELSIVDMLNELDWKSWGYWKRQDPGFPDALFISDKIKPNPGIEIKTWFPLATEITARFKDSSSKFNKNEINVALVAWLPEYLIWGKPKIIDVWIGPASSIAAARDKHYHNPPDYLIFEPEDTKNRTVNLQQTNTNGYKFQGNAAQLKQASELVNKWGKEGKTYKTSSYYQALLRTLLSKFPYRLDTNFAKIDRIEHDGLEGFKKKVLNSEHHKNTLGTWGKIFSKVEDEGFEKYLTGLF
jgi:hypothetical protein